MKILITGATGFLGTHLAKALQSHELTLLSSKTCDLTDFTALHQFTDKYDQIYHLAAWTQAGDFCLRHPGEQWIINQKINTNVLEWWATNQPQAKLIAMGTSCVYDETLPLTEEHFLQGTPTPSLFTYAMTKKMLLTGLISMQKQFGLKYLYLIPSTLYGGGYHNDGRQMHFIFDLARKILQERPVVLWGDGHQVRELIHVEDFVNTMLLLNRTVENTWINIGAGSGHTIRHFADILCDLTGYQSSEIQYDTSRYVGAKSKVLDITKLKTILPTFAPRPLEEGLKEVIQWFQNTVGIS